MAESTRPLNSSSGDSAASRRRRRVDSPAARASAPETGETSAKSDESVDTETISHEGEADTRTRLLDAAGPVFAARGYDRATLREITDSAGVNVASVGYHFGDKLGLYREVIRGIRESRERRFPTPNHYPGDSRQTLYQIVRNLLSRMLACDESGWETQLMMREMNRPTPVFESMVREFFRPQFDRLVATIQELTGDDIEKHRLEQLALSTIGQCLYYRIGSGIIQVLIPEPELKQHYDIDSLASHITAVMLAATEGGALVDHLKQSDQWQATH